MKKGIILGVILFGTILIFSCQNNQQRQINIQIALDSIPQDVHTAYLDILKPTRTLTIDTLDISEKQGNFSFHLFSKKPPSLLRIRIGKEYSFLIVGGEKNMSVSGVYKQNHPLTIEGSTASKEIQQFIAGMNRQNNELNKLSESLYNAPKPLSDSLTHLKILHLQKGKEALRNDILQKAKRTQSPTIAIFALSILAPKNFQKEGKTIAAELPTRFPGNLEIQSAVNLFKKELNSTGNNLTTHVGDMAPMISFPNPQGKEISLTDFKGKYVLIDFWASWCAPCRKANPKLVKIYHRFSDKNFTILGVSLDSKKSAWVDAIQKDGLIWQQMSDLKGWKSTPAAIFNIKAIPANFLINPKGVIIAKQLQINELIDKLEHIFSKQNS